MPPEDRRWIAVNPLADPTPLRLETPVGILTAEEWSLGRIEWRAPEGAQQTIVIEALEAPKGLAAPEGVEVTVLLPSGA